MVEVRLHGALARDFGKVWNLDISSPREAVAAIECARRGFSKRIQELDRQGLVFKVRTKTHDYCDKDVGMSVGSSEWLDIIPIVRGSSAGARFVVGAVLVAASFIPGIAGTPLQAVMISTGAGLVVGAVTEWLTPSVKKEDYKSVESWTISGPSNTADQGSPVPVIYGEVLVGSVPVSAGISVDQITTDGAVGPSCAIGGATEHSFGGYGAGTYTQVVTLSVGAFNLQDPFTYAWSVAGFNNAVAKRLMYSDKATMRLELDYAVTDSNPTGNDAGTVRVVLTGRKTNGADNTSAEVGASKVVTVSYNCQMYDAGYGY